MILKITEITPLYCIPLLHSVQTPIVSIIQPFKCPHKLAHLVSVTGYIGIVGEWNLFSPSPSSLGPAIRTGPSPGRFRCLKRLAWGLRPQAFKHSNFFVSVFVHICILHTYIVYTHMLTLLSTLSCSCFWGGGLGDGPSPRKKMENALVA